MENSGDPKRTTAAPVSVDVRVLFVTKLVANHFNICGDSSYKLSVDKKTKEFCFSDDDSSRRMPIAIIQKYQIVKSKKTMTLDIWSASEKKCHPLTFSASSSFCGITADLRAIGFHGSVPESKTEETMGKSCHVNKPPDLESESNRNNEDKTYSVEDEESQATREEEETVSLRGIGDGAENPDQVKSSNCPRASDSSVKSSSEESPGFPDHLNSDICNMASQLQTSTPPSQVTVQKPPYEPNELTDSEKEVNEEDILTVYQHVATKYFEVALGLSMPDDGDIKLRESFNNYCEASSRLLHEWHKQNGSKATVKKLAEVLYKVGLYGAAKLLSDTGTAA